MAHKVTIECEARFVDHLSNGSKKASDSINNIGKSAEKAEKKVNNLGKKKIKPIFDADTNKLLKKLREAETRAQKLGKTKTTVVLKAMDKATNVIGKVLNKAQSFGGKVWSAILKVKDSQALDSLGKVTTAAKTIAGKTWNAIVKVKDYATAPLTKIKNMLFSIKTLAAAIVAGVATKKLVMDPIALADQYTSAQIGFKTLLGDERAQQMMDEIDKFAKRTPFNTSGVISNVQKMMAYGWDVERVIKDMETIGDAAAGTGKGDEGLESIVYALSEIRSKGKLSTQELNQLAGAGIKAKRYLAEGLGYGSSDAGMAKLAKDLERGAIGANQAIDLILEGMKEFDGMMDKIAKERVEGLISQVKDAFEINVFRRWGQGLQEGAKRGLGTLVSLLDDSEEALASLGDTLYLVGNEISNWAADKLEKAVKTIKEVTGTDGFKNATIGGKVKILWNEVIAKPFSQWWNSEGKAKIAGIASDVGKGIGTGITGGLCALLGFNAEDAIADGVSIGGSFMEGFLEGFDTDKIGEALSNWVNDNKVLATVLGGVLAGKLIGGLVSFGSSVKNLFGGSGGGTSLSDYATATMNVTAGVVNIFGGSGFGSGTFGGSGGRMLLPGSGSAVKGLLGSGSTSAGSGLTALLAKVGVSLGSGATTTAGAAAAGAGGISGAIGLALGVISAGVDIFQAIKKNKSGDKKSAKDEYFAAGTKGGMMAAGAGIGAAIGSVVPGLGTGIGALVGGGIGGIIGLFTGDKAGKALSDASEEGGWLSNAGKAISKFFTETLPNGWNRMWEGIGNFFSEKLPYALGYAIGKVGTFFTETLPNGWNNFWSGVGTFFTETIPAWAETVKEATVTFFTETIPAKWDEFWTNVDTFVTETIPTWAGNLRDSVSTFFTETVPGWFSNVVENIGDWWSGVKGNFSAGLEAGKGKKARGGIVGGTSSSMEAYARGGIVGGSTRWIRVNEESPEMIIPLSSQRRDRAMKLWARTGQLLGAPGFARGGRTSGENDEGIRFHGYDQENPNARTVAVNFGDIRIELKVEATDKEGVVKAIKEQLSDIAESVAGIFADEFEALFENTPVRGEVT